MRTVIAEDRVFNGMATLTDGADLSVFSIGRAYALTSTAAQAISWVASAVQDELAGYEFVQWPLDGWQLLTPELTGSEAVWAESSTGSVVSAIGALCDPAEGPWRG